MIRNYRVKRFLAPTIALRFPAMLVFLGLALLLSGFVLSFRQLIVPWLTGFADLWARLLSGVVGPDSLEDAAHLLGGVLLVVGGYLVYRGARRGVGAFLGTLSNDTQTGMMNTFMRKQQLAQGPFRN